MVFGSIVSSPLGSLMPQQALDLANLYLENARNSNDVKIALVLCHDTEVSLSHARKTAKHGKNQTVIEGIITAYVDLGELLESRSYGSEAQVSYKKAEKLGWNVQNPDRPKMSSRPISIAQSLKETLLPAASPQLVESIAQSPKATPLPAASPQTVESVPNTPLDQHKQQHDVVTFSADIFAENVRPPTIEFKLPEPDERLNNTPQLACCLGLLIDSHSLDDELEPAAQNWLQAIEKDTDEKERLRSIAKEVIRTFHQDEFKDAKAIAEVICLAPVINKEEFQHLLREFYSEIDRSGLLNIPQLEGLARLIQGADIGHLSSDDLVEVLGHLTKRLMDTHHQSEHHRHQLTLAVSNVLDAMADTKVTGLDRTTLHAPLLAYLKELEKKPDPYLVYQAAYAFQALLCVPDNEKTWQAAMRRTGKVFQGVSGVVSAVKGLDLVKFVEGLEDIQKGFTGAFKVVKVVQDAYKNVSSLATSGKDLLDCLKDGLSFDSKRDWYTALRGADAMIREGKLATFRKLVYQAPCRLDPAFQWGVCQRLGEIASNPMWDAVTRRNAIEFLGEIYDNDDMWGQESSVKQWILNILMRLALSSDTNLKSAGEMLKKLETSGDDEKQALYQLSIKNEAIAYPLKIALPELASPSLIDRAQNRPDVESNIRLLRKQRRKERGNAIYIQPQAKASLQASDDVRFELMKTVKDFLASDQKVFLLLGDSGTGKSMFNLELEFELWKTYKNKTGRIPLHINLPAIDKPEHDMIAKQLRKSEFTEPQIREMKHHRKFILICDGYDESQQTHNLYMSNRLNQQEEWDAQMVISCRSEYAGTDYRGRFQPGDRNQESDSSLFQEAVITQFSLDQVQAYIQEYVKVHQPLWQAKDYNQALEHIPSLKELVKNPFLMTLSLEVLPRIVDPTQRLSAARVTRVSLYDHFVDQWLERGKKRIGEKDLSPQARAAFESLSDDGFTQHGTEFLKNLAVAIYKEQGGNPVVQHSRVKGEISWKDPFFGRDDEKQLLREACPLTRTGNQHRFIHRSLLEYGLTRAVFDPQDARNRTASKAAKGRRGSVSSTLSFESHDGSEEEATIVEQEPNPDSPLAWKNFVNDHSLLQFLEERVQQEPVFKEQLLAYIEHSKNDKKWRKAAANAITILVRAGVQFIGTDFRGIQIPGADLSYGVFDSTQFQDADMRKVNLRGVWLRQTDLSRAQMTGVQFGELPYLMEGDKVRSCTYSPDGKSLAAGLFNGDITVYTASDWEKTRKLKGHTDMVRCVVYSPKGNQIASASQDKTVRLWDTETGDCGKVLTGHRGYVHGVAYSPQGDLIATASDDKTVKLWDVVTGDCRQTFSGHTGGVLSVAYSPNGKQIASGSADNTVRLWDVETGVCRVLSGHNDKVWDIAYSPQGDQIISAGTDTTIRQWDVKTGVCRQIISGYGSTVNSVAYSPKGGQFVSGSVDRTVRLWDVDTGVCRHTIAGHTSAVFSVTYSPNGDQVASGGSDKTVRLWDVSVGASRVVSSGHRAGVMSVKCSPKGDQIASCSLDKEIRLWDVETGACCRTLRGHSNSVYGIAYSPQGGMIISGCGDKSVKLWDMETGDCLFTLTGLSGEVLCVAYSPQGDIIASGSADRTVRLWNVQTGECFKTLDGHADGVLSIVYSPNGNQIATGSKDKTAKLWDTGTGECLRALQGHDHWVKAVVYSPQGDQLVTASFDMTVRLWDVETETCRSTLTGHTDAVWSAAYSMKGDLLATGSDDKTIRLWDVTTGECRAVVQNFQGSVDGIAWNAISDDNYLVTGCGDGSVLKWQVIEEGDLCNVRLCWSATNGALTVTGASIQDVHGLTQVNKQLLKQRGVIGEPENLLREASKKVIAIASMVSRLKLASGGMDMDSSSTADPSIEHSEHQLEQTNDSEDTVERVE